MLEGRIVDREQAHRHQQELALLDALLLAVDRRADVLDVVSGAADSEAAVVALRALLDIEDEHARAILDLSFHRLTESGRAQIAVVREERRSASQY